ncbi:MAG: hypothetical protein CFH22_01075 [Alphaproteobacteria bacterium MarineAlpha5_Bin12]|nr:MAG: hypothetical protein CFH22_01075 [Alphaproteobacteria bacterium MarineAlpha5_Bin12]
MEKEKKMKSEEINIFAENKIIFSNLENKIDKSYDSDLNFFYLKEIKGFKFKKNQLNIFFIPPNLNSTNCKNINKFLKSNKLDNIIICVDKTNNKYFAEHDILFHLPISFSELMKKVNFLKLSSNILFKNLQLNRLSRELININNKNTIVLTQIESNILSVLMRSEKKVSRELLNSNALGYSKNIDSHSLDSHIYRIRKKLLRISKENLINAIDSGFYELS